MTENKYRLKYKGVTYYAADSLPPPDREKHSPHPCQGCAFKPEHDKFSAGSAHENCLETGKMPPKTCGGHIWTTDVRLGLKYRLSA